MATLVIAQSAILSRWFKLVNDAVTEPYLDEVFHVRQAQQYCQGRFDVWDPKITTPPGLYLVSYLLSPLAGGGLSALRAVSLVSLTLLLLFVSWTYAIRQTSKQHRWLAKHSTLNITLFPPLFFFSALYYTDAASTLSVLVFYYFFLHSHRQNTSAWISTPTLILLGSLSLLFRQTNVFWVAVFPAATVLVNELDTGHQVVKDSMYSRAEGFGDSMLSVARTSWKMEVIYHPSVRDACIEDYFKTIISVAACGLKVSTSPNRLGSLSVALAPYITLLALFAAFILWNGSVVLGDKSNHIATIHLPQMLYIWPYFAFFSWPLLYPYLLSLPVGLMARLPNVAPLEAMLMFKRRHLAPRLWLLGSFIVATCLVVYFNTIVHPFTLADNRHYTFYVFRLLMRPAWVKYAVTPIYIVCAWACIQALSARPLSTTRPNSTQDTNTAPSQSHSKRPLALPDGTNSATTSFVLIWLITTTLQLISAPLVEPRYLILPWIFWRMHVPLQQYTPAPKTTEIEVKAAAQDHRLWLETVWLLLVNGVTGYIFLKWEFSWLQEPGKVQRFMW